MKLRKWLSLGIALLSVTLAARIGLVSPLQLISEAGESPQYIGEVKTFCASSVSEAQKAARKEGYTVVDGNLNSGTGYKAVVLGYKTTEDREAAITDISMAQMKSGYKMVSYGDVAKKQVEKLDGVGSELLTAVNEFADNYKKGSPAAKTAYRILNYYQTDAEGSPLLGDYFLSGACTKDYLLKILSRANTAVVNTLYNALVAGTADCGDSTWAQRVADSDIRRMVDEGDCGKEEDVLYKEYALKLYAGVQDFAAKYEDAAARAAVAETDSLVEAEKGDVCDIPEDTLEDIEEGNKLDEQEGDAFYIAAYEALNVYRYNEETALGEYIVNVGKLTFSTTEELRQLYPLIEALTNGQAAVMRMTGLASFVFYLDNNEGLTETGEAYFEEIDQKISDYNHTAALSLWVGTDQTIYDKKVALTDELERYSQAGKSYADLTREDAVEETLSELMNLVSFVSLVVSIAYSVTVLSANAVGYLASFAVWAGTATTWTVCVSAIGSGVLGTLLGVLGCVAIVASYLVLAAMVIILVAMFVNWVIHLFDDEDEEYTEIPVVIYDLFGSACVKYELVPSSSSVADLNAGEGKRWNALYTTTDTALGEPITVDSLGNALSVSVGSNVTPSGYAPVKNFGEVVAANLNANVRESEASPIYLYYHNGTGSAVINEGEAADTTEDTDEKTEYLWKLMLSTEASEAAAKAALVKRDYIVLDVDLSPMAEKHTYLGYMVTTDPSKAITDIRISAHNTQSPFLFGDSSYTNCGQTPTGDGLYYTSYDGAGTPIFADLQVADSYEAAREGFEPVNLFCGGNAYNFNNGDNSDDDTATAYDHFKDVKRLLYFHPTVTYTEGEEYLAGIVLVAGTKAEDNRKNLEQYIKELGLTRLDINLTQGLEVKRSTSFINGAMLWDFDTLETYVCYSTTHNPYRAITDLRTYTSAPANNQVFANFGTVQTGGFSVCDVYYQLPEAAQADNDEDEYYRGIYTNHSYMNCLGADVVWTYDEGEMAPEDYETVSWSASNVRAKGLYVCGPMEGKTPLRVEDICLTREATASEGFISVQDARTPNGTAAHNIAFYKEDGDRCQKAYLYLRKTRVEKEYIAAVNVVTYDLNDLFDKKELEELEDEQKEAIDKTADDTCIRQLLSSCGDEILNVNVAADAADTYQADPETVNTNCSYIGITRTTDASQAITGLIKYKGKSALPEITVNGVTYTKCGDKINDENGGYWLYSAVSSGAVPGEPITDITLDTQPIVSGAATVLNAKAEDTASAKAALYGATGDAYYIHTHFEEKNTHVSALYLGHGKTKNEALCNLLTQGCCMALDRNLNENAGGEYIYLGYSKYTPKTSDKKAKFAVRDILVTVNQPYAAEIDVDGVTYLAAASDCKNGLSLNRGTGGDTVYLYYTTYFISDVKAVLSYSPILKIGSAVRDRVPDSEDTYAWENVVTTEGTRANLNAGVISSDDGGVTMKDCRVYLFVNRMDNSVVPARKITGGHCEELVNYGKVTVNT